MSDEYTNGDAQVKQLDETFFFGLHKYIAKDGQPTAEETEAQRKWREETPKCINVKLAKC